MENFANVIDEVPFGEDPTIYIDPESALHDDMDADACLQKIGNWERFRKFWLDFYQKKIDEVNQKCDNNIEFNRRKLKDYFATVPHRSTKTQDAYDLPSGKLAIVYSKPKLAPDKHAILERLKNAGEMEFVKTKTTEDLDWQAYKDRLFISEDGESVIDRETGEVLKDVAIEQNAPEFKVTPNKKKGEEENVRESEAV